MRLHELGAVDGRREISQQVIHGLATETHEASYAAAVVLAQDWVMRYPLIDGEGNFGSSYPDAPASMEFTEMGLAAAGSALSAGAASAEDVLAGEFPNYFANGSTAPGGMLSHNLGETVAALIALIETPALDLDGLIGHLRGPDLPTGGVIIGRAEIREAYATGRSTLRVRPRLRVEEDPRSVRIRIDEQLFRVGFGSLFDSIIDHIRSGTLDVVQEMHQESDSAAVIAFGPLRSAEDILERLYAHTELESTVELHIQARTDGTVRTLSLLEAMQLWLEPRLHRLGPVALTDRLRAIAQRHGDPRRSAIGLGSGKSS